MWVKVALCFLVAVAYADRSPGWKPNHAYVYQVRGRILTSLNQINSNYTGILIKSTLTVRPRSDGHLGAQVSDAQYADVHSRLWQSWDQEIPESQLSYQPIPLSNKPFKILTRDGVISDIVVDESVQNYESNILKGIVGQLQMDTESKNLIVSSINTLTESDSNDGRIFKTMEATVSGRTETLYEIHPFPEYVSESRPWAAGNWDQNEPLFEVVKTKNFTHSKENPSYHFGFQGFAGFESSNHIGDFFGRTSMTRAVLSGSRRSYTIQSSVTTEEITLHPNMQDNQRGSSQSMINITLQSLDQQNEEFEDVSNPVQVGLVYRYDQPFHSNNEARRFVGSQENDDTQSITSAESRKTWMTPEEYPRVQDKPHLHEAPASPLLPYTVGYNGQSITKQFNVKEKVRTLSMKIGQESQHHKTVLRDNTVGKFVVLASLIRTMNHQEMKEVSSQMYTQEKHGEKAAAWVAFRDAVAQSGTGPALVIVNEWISNEQIREAEAAQIIATVASSARQPTENYVKFFYDMLQNEKFMQQKYLNESLLLSFSTLVNHVYVDARLSHNKYPVHSFGSFNTEQGRLFVQEELIPFLSTKLNEYILKADTQRIHTYIRAIGNVGHPEILSTFKPYLEGTKKASQFQRVLMVMALDKLVKVDPKLARSVLFKIYENPKDVDQVRVAAVHLLILTYPSASMLQRMAMYTNIDTSKQVNSAVKSIIESASRISSPEYYQTRIAAKSAKPHLTSENYGAQNSKAFLQNYISEHMKLQVKHITTLFGGEDSIIPKGWSLLFRPHYEGSKHELFDAKAMTSSIQDLVNVFEQQTKTYRRLLKEKQSYQSENTKWSSENSAKILNMQNEQREQLENYVFLQIDALQSLWSFDNQTVENLTQIVREWEDQLRNGKHFDYNKMSNFPEMAVSFPNAWGIPFIYTHDRPVLMRWESNIKAQAAPTLYSDGGIQKPNTINVEYTSQGHMTARAQSQFGVFVPFTHKRYSAGYDKNFQIVVPQLNGKIHFDVQHKQFTVEIGCNERTSTNLLHFSTWPYTSQYAIEDVKPHTQIIRSEQAHTLNFDLGQQWTGIGLNVNGISDKPLDLGFWYDKLLKEDFVAGLIGSWMDRNIQHTHINLSLDLDKTTTRKVVMHFGQMEKFSNGLPNDKSERIPYAHPLAEESWKRQNEFLKNSRREIIDSLGQVCDATISFEGHQSRKYSTTLARASSRNDPKGRILVQVQKDDGNRPFKVSMVANSRLPNTPSLDLKSAMEFDPSSKLDLKVTIEDKIRASSKINFALKLTKSEERKEFLKRQQQYKECEKEMSEGNKQLPACSRLTTQANLLDKFRVSVDYENVNPALINQTYKYYSALRHYLYPHISENILADNQANSHQIEVEGQFNPELSTVSASANFENKRVEISDVKINQFWRNVLVIHPSHDVKERVAGYLFNYDTYHPTCVVDKTAVNTLDNKTFPATLPNDWVVVLHYVPRRPSSIKNQPELTVAEQLNQQIEGYIVYSRASGSQKEVKIVIQTPETRGKVMDLTLKPSDSNGYPRLFLQGAQVMYDTAGEHIYDGFLQVFKLPSNELKVEIYDAFHVIYDGERAKLSITNEKFRDSVRGLCGTFTGEQETDFTHPGNCIIHSPDVFVATNTVPEKSRTKRMNDMLMIQAEEKTCYQKSVGYTNVYNHMGRQLSRNSRMTEVARYVQEGNQVCFTIKPVLRCKPGYRQTSVTRNVPVHCVKSTGVSDLMKHQIDQGVIPTSFSNKPATKEVLLSVAERCDV